MSDLIKEMNDTKEVLEEQCDIVNCCLRDQESLDDMASKLSDLKKNVSELNEFSLFVDDRKIYNLQSVNDDDLSHLLSIEQKSIIVNSIRSINDVLMVANHNRYESVTKESL